MNKSVSIRIPKKIQIDIEQSSIFIMGKLGSTYIEKEPFMICNKTGEFLECSFTLEGVSRKQANITNRKFSQFLSNLKTSLKGVSSGFYIELSLKGVGYRFLSYKDNILVMKVGFCNNVSFEIPKGVEIFIESPTQLTLFSIDYSFLKQVASSLRGLRRPDAYKGKGFRYTLEKLNLKEINKNG